MFILVLVLIQKPQEILQATMMNETLQ